MAFKTGVQAVLLADIDWKYIDGQNGDANGNKRRNVNPAQRNLYRSTRSLDAS
jgi:hypothetical protein